MTVRLMAGDTLALVPRSHGQVHARNVPDRDEGGKAGDVSDPYMRVSLLSADGNVLAEKCTSTLRNQTHPYWKVRAALGSQRCPRPLHRCVHRAPPSTAEHR